VLTDSYLESTGNAETVTSPFAGMSLLETTSQETEQDPRYSDESPFEAAYATESPFAENTSDEADHMADEAADFLESVHDEDFDEALEQLLNEGAAHVLADAQKWTAAPSAAEARESAEQWIAPLVSEWERAIDALQAGLEGADLHEFTQNEFDEFLDSMEITPALQSEVFENFLGGLISKARRFISQKVHQAVKFVKNPVKGIVEAAKSGLQTIKSGVKFIGNQLLGPLLARLKGIGLALLKGVIAKLVTPLTRLLPAPVRPLVPILMKKLGVSEATENEDTEATGDHLGTAALMAHEFDHQLLDLYLSDQTDETSEQLDEAIYDEEPHRDSLAELEDARELLAQQLSAYTGSEPPVAEIEQFVPVVLAIRPLLKLGLKITGAREKLINLIATPLAKLIKDMIGPAATETIARAIGQEPSRMLARAAVNVGFTALGLEAPAHTDQELPGQALASAVESTVLRVADELDESAAADPLQVSAAVQRAFAEAAAAYLPDRVLRSDLPERETADEGGVWIMMPRSVGRRYRFSKYSRVFVVPISRQMARAVRWSDGGTMEGYLLDHGVREWPVQAEVDLYETLPGTVPGHFTRDETLPGAEKPTADEFQPLTAETAGLLLGHPALGRGRRPVVRAGAYRPIPGQRFYRIRVAHLPTRRHRRPRRLVSVHWNPLAKRLRVSIRLSERRARSLQERMQRSAPAGQRDLPAVMTALDRIYSSQLKFRIARRLVNSSVVADPSAAAKLAVALAAAVRNAISAFLVQRGAVLAAAIADPADGVTIRITFNGLGANPQQVPTPTVTAVPGLV
jgi:hypothetical protein